MDHAPDRDAAVAARLRQAGSVFAEEEAASLVEGSTTAEHLESLVLARMAGQPLEHLVGHVVFHGLRVPVGPGIFVPRQRTAHLVDCALGLVRETSTVLDLCCGCGAIGYALSRAAECEIDVWATDLDEVSVGYASRLLPAGRVVRGDLFGGLPSTLRFDLIVANAPYVPTARVALMPPEARDHEPRAALDGGDDGLAVHRRMAGAAGRWMTSTGRFVTEIGEPQIVAATSLYRSAGFDVTISRDDEIDATALIAWRRAGR
ncbi:putative protein N(5)-glutamine methyltransferase [Nakamurella sp. A5-74]|uniref:Methyltransferase small domain-containing protein n=1 Tax=Nakamurella sp. A5-74 TaxID=3158264 RepID=A0AAU8DRP4_9ACTN